MFHYFITMNFKLEIRADISVIDFLQKKSWDQLAPKFSFFGRQNKYFSRQKLYLRTNGIQ